MYTLFIFLSVYVACKETPYFNVKLIMLSFMLHLIYEINTFTCIAVHFLLFKFEKR